MTCIYCAIPKTFYSAIGRSCIRILGIVMTEFGSVLSLWLLFQILFTFLKVFVFTQAFAI